MRPEDRLLFTCTRQQFTATHRQTVLELCQHPSLDWSLVYTTAVQHGVAPLVYANLSSCVPSGCTLPAPVHKQFEQHLYANIVCKARVARQMAAGLRFAHQLEMDVMLVKGAAHDLVVFDQSWYATHDVDLVFRPRHGELSTQVRNKLSSFFGQFAGFEYDFFTHHDVMMNGVLALDFEQIWAEARPVVCHGQTAWVMCPEDLLLAACINSCRKRFFRLKSLLDISAIIERFAQLDWPSFLTKVRRYDCRHIAYAALLITEGSLGCSLPAGLLEQLRGGWLRTALIHGLSRRLSLDAFTRRHVGLALWRRTVDWPLLLSYACFTPMQSGRRLRYVWQTRGANP